MAALAMWFQDASTSGFSGGSANMVAWALVVIAIALALQALLWIGVGIGALIAVGKVKKAVDDVRNDVKGHVGEIKAKVYPLVDKITHVTHTAQAMLDENSPKVKAMVEHLVETSVTVRDTAHKLSGTVERLGDTVSEVNHKTQRQVARVDGMVTAALDTTAEVVASVEHGIKVPAQKIAQAATQARFVVEGVVDRLKGMASGLPFMQQKTQGTAGEHRPVNRSERPVESAERPVPRSGAPAAVTPMVPARSTPAAPATGTGPIPVIK